ncbi:hypothetical protein J6S37_02655 [Candidatus Saccharibacteria bacterium]|nr:hypothetical protein [Candidatus Saccharibacteria bacterium]
MDNNKTGSNRWIYVLAVFLGTVIIFVLIAFFLMNGSGKIINTEGDISVTESMVCSENGIIYPFFTYDNSNSKNIKINVVFKDDKLDTISLIASLYYSTAEQIKQSSASNHAALYESFYADSMSADLFDMHFSTLDDAMQMTLYTDAKKLNGMNSKYFLIDSVSGFTKEKLKKEFNSHGLNCVIKEEKK